MKTTAALLRDPGGALTLEELDVPDPEGREVLVRLKGVGVCHTDLGAIHGAVPLPLPAVLGHEGAGIVEAVGESVEGLAVGDHVVLSFDSCGDCSPCTTGHPAYCELFAALNYFGTRLDGTAVRICKGCTG